jgi:hypothetical protein
LTRLHWKQQEDSTGDDQRNQYGKLGSFINRRKPRKKAPMRKDGRGEKL